MIHVRLILNLNGLLLMLVAFTMPVGAIFSLYYGDDDILALFQSALITLAAGSLMYALNGAWKADYRRIRKRDGYIVVTSSWVLISIFGALPYVIYGTTDSYTDAFFETMSGFTTTGASLLNDLDNVPHGIMFWRLMTHWLGGMGVIVLTLAILPLLGVGGAQLFMAEVAGPTQEKIHPQVQGTAKRLWAVYVLLTILLTILLLIGGMNLFDALCHAFSTMATGGFSTRQQSVGAFSPFIQYVIIIFMIIGGTNFALHYHAFHGRLKAYLKDEEFLFYCAFLLIVTTAIFLGVYFYTDGGLEGSFRDAAFQVTSIVTSTGFATADYDGWEPFGRPVFFLLLFTGACAGSTTGSIKMIRLLLLIKNGSLELKRLVHPRAVIPIRINRRIVPNHIINNVLAFFGLYLFIFIVATTAMCFEPSFAADPLDSAMGAVAATLGCMGPGIGAVGPTLNYHDVSIAGKWLLSLLMLLGRLDVFTIFILLSPSFWKL